MKRSTDRILTSHAGSLPRPDDLIKAYRGGDRAQIDTTLKRAVADVVSKQVEVGVDIVNDGEFGKPTTDPLDYGAWTGYIYDRITGFEVREAPTTGPAIMRRSKDRTLYREFYESGGAVMYGPGSRPRQRICVGPIEYTTEGRAFLQRDIDNFKAALQGAQVADPIMMVLAPPPAPIAIGDYYKSPEEQTEAMARALQVEYKAITDAGINIQIDDPWLPTIYDFMALESDFAAYRKWAESQVEAVNRALQGIPQEKVRYHLCWGSWHGPHSTDVPLKDIIDLILKVNAQVYSVEAANVRHEHEWKVWRDAKLPDGKIVMPGVVSHSTNVLEHPEVVADRIGRYAEAVGRENVIAGTDCGLGGRIHYQLVWAKLQALAEGAALASKQLWG